MLIPRIITAVVLIPLALLAIYYLPPLGFESVLGAIMLGCAWEWTTLMKMQTLFERIVYLVIIGLLFLAVVWLPMGYYLYAAVIGLVGLSFLLHHYQNQQGQFKLKGMWWYIIGIALFVTCWYSINIIRFKAGGANQVLMLLLIVWIADTAAYFTGTYFGKTKLAPLVSPNKSWEGIKGAATAVFILTLIEVVIAKLSFAVFVMVLLTNAATFIASIYGDLFESMMKRIADCKDSGGLLPGHGGLLDRLDSLFFAAPVYATGCLLMLIHFS